MKASRYNHFFPYSDKQSIAYNAFTNALALIDLDKLAAYHAFINEEIPIPDELQDALHKGLFLIEDHVDERQKLRHNMLRSRYGSDYLNLTITPTNDCNFACVYCYEKGVLSGKYMTNEVQDKIVELVESRKGLIANLSVTWYGGEPLMAFDVIKNLSERFIHICKDNDIKYNATMITNGYLLTRDVLTDIKELSITSLQITIDGLPEIHNKMRPLVGGGW